jgi:hypothetical protein
MNWMSQIPQGCRHGEAYIYMKNEDRRLFVYRIDAKDRISFVNDEWIAFGVENGLSGLTAERVIGKSLWDFVADLSVRHLYKGLFDKVRAKKSSPKIPYRCDSPDCRRTLRMEVSASQDGEIQLASRILQQKPRPAISILKQSAVRSDELLAICSVCKKLRLRENRWYEIEDAVGILGMYNAGPYPQLTHTICDGCFKGLNEKFSSL